MNNRKDDVMIDIDRLNKAVLARKKPCNAQNDARQNEVIATLFPFGIPKEVLVDDGHYFNKLKKKIDTQNYGEILGRRELSGGHHRR